MSLAGESQDDQKYRGLGGEVGFSRVRGVDAVSDLVEQSDAAAVCTAVTDRCQN
jgi:hypothetical protein